MGPSGPLECPCKRLRDFIPRFKEFEPTIFTVIVIEVMVSMRPLTSQFSILTDLDNELTVFLRTLTCKFLNFTISLNDLMTY